jgi:hypothetical protein
LHKSLNKIAADCFVAFLLEPHTAAELDPRAPFCLGTIEAGTFQIVGAVLDMGAKLLLHLIRNLRRMKKFSGKGMKLGQEFHYSNQFTPPAAVLKDRAIKRVARESK